MKHVRFKPYLGPAFDGTTVLFRCDSFDTSDFKKMISKPVHLTPISFQAAHQIWAEISAELLLGDDTEEMVRVCNKGFVDYLEELGYRIVPRLDEIEIF